MPLSDPGGRAMRRRAFLGVLGSAAAMSPFPAYAQQASRMQRVGVLAGVAEEASEILLEFAYILEQLPCMKPSITPSSQCCFGRNFSSATCRGAKPSFC